MLEYYQIREICDTIDKKIKEKSNINDYYNGRKLLTTKDKYGKQPVLYISTNNRSAGKTTYFAMFSYYLKKIYGFETVFLCRKVAELKSYHEIFGDAAAFYEWKETFSTSVKVKDTITQIKIDNECLGYVLCLKKDNDIKKYSPIFRDVELVIEDEYQPEDGKFIKDEPKKLQRILRSIGRGGGAQARDIITILLGNPVTLLNPYLIRFNIPKYYNVNRDYIKEKRIVAEFTIQQNAAKQMEKSALNELYNDKESDYVCGKSFLIASQPFIKKCNGKSKYLFSIIYDDTILGVRQSLKDGSVHVGKKFDKSCKMVLSFRAADMEQNRIMIANRDFTWNRIRNAFKFGNLYFEDEESKYIMFDLIGIDIYN